jgi:hypothetical protein
MNVLMMITVMVLMISFSLVLSHSVSKIVLKPLEKLLVSIRHMASTIFQSVTTIATSLDEEEENQKEDDEDAEDAPAATAFSAETDLLEKVVQKLAVLSEVTANKTAATSENMQESDRALIFGFQGSIAAEDSAWKSEGKCDNDMLAAQQAMVENSGLSLDLINSWALSPLELDKARNHAAALYFLAPHNHGMTFDAVTMNSFLTTAEGEYNRSCPYHNWFHAVDVTHCVYRLLQICSAEAYLSNTERFGLIASAVCHDVCHPGLNNIFLTETSHELALRYNDKSPLENMHCAKMFEILGQRANNIFSHLSTAQFHEIRKICIGAILHTDNAMHFVMVKDVQMLYEMNSEILDSSREIFNEDPSEFPTTEAAECFRQPESRKLLVKLLLHTADISNSMKPFRICRIWAGVVLEEFFLQGDSEKRLGVPVQALNDREKVNRAFSQVGFIEFLVSPLLLATCKVVPPVEVFMTQMLHNVEEWHKLWLSDTVPTPSEAERTSMEERLARLEQKCSELQGA